MAERQRRIVPHAVEAQAHRLGDGEVPPTFDLAFEVVEEWKPESPVEEWTEWRYVSSEQDEDPTYYPEYDPHRGNIFHVPIKAIHPHRRSTTTFERRLVRRWVDAEHGPMAEVVDVQTRTERV